MFFDAYAQHPFHQYIFRHKLNTETEIYIGETGRMLSVKEHLAGKRRGSLLTPLGRHRLEEHQGDDFDIKSKILAYESEIGARKILEALHIRERNPKLNNRNECIAITSELLPFIPFCGL
uniref:GIY-YIG domain-containing protein n=1 Tax=Haemonchus contortus TaxID=6289 RepID=A0A7I4YM57_HAECO